MDNLFDLTKMTNSLKCQLRNYYLFLSFFNFIFANFENISITVSCDAIKFPYEDFGN